jgi:L-rhamnose-H+ transport protein
MPESVWMASVVVLIGGVMEGSFAFPMKLARKWRWENIWLVYSVAGLVAIPWIAALFSVPNLSLVYQAVPLATLLSTAGFGFGWGVANVLFGLAVPMLGMALSFAVVVGMSAALGSLIPLILQAPQRLAEPSGIMIVAGVIVTLIGVAILGKAGRSREREAGSNAKARSVTAGLALCVCAGLLAPMLNFSFAFGGDIVESGIRQGAGSADAVNAVWAIALAGGFLSNAGYCLIELNRNNSWRNFSAAAAGVHWLWGALMGLLWTGGLLLYGRGAAGLGELGAAVGWPLFQATMIVASSLAGALSGEWRGAGPAFLRWNTIGLLVLLSAILLLSFGNRM